MAAAGGFGAAPGGAVGTGTGAGGGAGASTGSYPIQYVCGDCNAINQLRSRDDVRCHACGYRILYKMRTRRLTQYEARYRECCLVVIALFPIIVLIFCVCIRSYEERPNRAMYAASQPARPQIAM